MAQVFQKVEGQWAAKAAIDIALMDWVGQKLGVPLYRYFGLDPKDAPVTTFSIGIDTPEMTRKKVEEAAQFPVLKIKVGLDTDEATMETVRSITKKPLRVDANEGWNDKEEAVRKINWLEKMGVEFVEQPMPAAMLEETRWVRSRVHIPIIADEACMHAADIPKLRECFDGVNIKLDKSGGIIGRLPNDRDREIVGHEDHARLYDLEFGHRHCGSAPFTACRLCRPGRQHADLQRSVSRCNGERRPPYSTRRERSGAETARLVYLSSPHCV